MTSKKRSSLIIASFCRKRKTVIESDEPQALQEEQQSVIDSDQGE